jgi:hypothetical protein
VGPAPTSPGRPAPLKFRQVLAQGCQLLNLLNVIQLSLDKTVEAPLRQWVLAKAADVSQALAPLVSVKSAPEALRKLIRKMVKRVEAQVRKADPCARPCTSH